MFDLSDAELADAFQLSAELDAATVELNNALAFAESMMRRKKVLDAEVDIDEQHVLAWRNGHLYVDKFHVDGEHISSTKVRSTSRRVRMAAAHSLAQLLPKKTAR